MLVSPKLVNSLLSLRAQLDAVFQMWRDENQLKSTSPGIFIFPYSNQLLFLASNLFFLEKKKDLVGISLTLHVCCYLTYSHFTFIFSDFSCHYFSSLLDFPLFSSTVCQIFSSGFLITFPGPFSINLCTSKIANFRVVMGTVKAWTVLCLLTILFVSEYLPSEFKYSQHPSTTSIQFTTFSICWEYKYSFVFSSSNPWVSMVSCGRRSMWSWLWKMSSFLMKAGGCPVEKREFQLSTQQKAWGLQFLSRHGGLKYYDFSPPKHCRSRQESN